MDSASPKWTCDLRGPGEMAGTRQSGMPEFRVANLMEDSEMLALAQREAEKWVAHDEERERRSRRLTARSGWVGPAGLVTVRIQEMPHVPGPKSLMHRWT